SSSGIATSRNTRSGRVRSIVRTALRPSPHSPTISMPGDSPSSVRSRRRAGGSSSTIAAAKTLAQRLALLPSVLAVADAMAYAHNQRIIRQPDLPGHRSDALRFGLAQLQKVAAASQNINEPSPIA